MKQLDIVHSFHDRRTQVSRGLCRVRSFAAPSGKVVLLTDLGHKNDGQSVTNAVELVIDSLIEQGLVIPPVTFVEHYERDAFSADTFDVVTTSPTDWKRLSRYQALRLIGGDESELDDRSDANPRIVEQADRLRFRRNPFVDSVHPESHVVVKRRLQIVESMISRASVKALVETGGSERELQRLLKTDLSILGEAYAKPDDEYICFSEFPIADGAVDFVVLTGRSRMDVILIEVKGADFNLGFPRTPVGGRRHIGVEILDDDPEEISRVISLLAEHGEEIEERLDEWDRLRLNQRNISYDENSDCSVRLWVTDEGSIQLRATVSDDSYAVKEVVVYELNCDLRADA